jgi:uncharacterized protein
MASDEREDDVTSEDAEAAKPPAKPRGFAAMSPEKRRELGSRGGRTAHARGVANTFTSETAREAGRIPHERGTAHKWSSAEAAAAGKLGGARSRRGRASKTPSNRKPAASGEPES